MGDLLVELDSPGVTFLYGTREDLQDCGGVRCGDHLPPHKYIKSTSMCRITPTEHLLKAGRRPQTSQKPCGWQGLGALAGCHAWASEVGEPSSRHWTTRGLPAPHNINWQELSQRSPSHAKTQLHSTTSKLQCWTPHHKKLGRQPHPLAERLPKIIISSQTHQNTPPNAVLPIRETRSSLIHQNTGTSPLHQEAYTTYWTNLTHWEQTPKTMGTMNVQPVKRRPQTQ